MPDNEDMIDAADAVPPDDLLDARIARLAAAHYHRPPDIVPRDAMWDAIVARRSGAAEGTSAATAVQPLHVSRTTRRGGAGGGAWGNRSAWWLAAAASLTLATGVGIGRWWSVASQAVVAGNDSAVAGPIAQRAAGDDAPPAPLVAERGDPADPVTARDAAESAAGAAANAALQGRAPDGSEPAAASPRSTTRRAPRLAAPRDPDVAYQLATLRHLTEVEALLVSYRDDSVDVALDEKLASWSRRLLDDTRLLLDSPAADDPRRRRLLEDLELVLVQMGALERSAPDRERPLIDETLRHSQLMPRLRAAVPAGVTGI